MERPLYSAQMEHTGHLAGKTITVIKDIINIYATHVSHTKNTLNQKSVIQKTVLHSTGFSLKIDINMKKTNITAFFAILMCMFSCSGKNISPLSSTITISSNSENVLDCNVFTHSIDTLLIKSCGEYFSPVQAACLTDSNLYIIDKAGSIGCFNINTGCLEKKIRKVGHGTDEYINPISLCESEGLIYVLDFQGCSILTYDLKLNFKKRVKLQFPALDFIKVPNGFLLYNMNVSDDLRQIVFVDIKGRVLSSYLSNKNDKDIMLTDKFFCMDIDGGIYFSEPSTNYIYKWENNSLTPQYYIEMAIPEKKGIPKKDSNNEFNGQHIRSFVVGDQIVTLYMQDGIVLANSYKQTQKKSYSGRVKTNIPYSFFPITYYNGSLYGLYDIETNHNNNNAFMMLVKYEIKK